MLEAMSNRKIKISDKKLYEYIKTGSNYERTFYVNLGVKVVRLICYSELFVAHIKRQLAYISEDNIADYDATIILWQENDIENIQKREDLFLGEENLNSRSITHIVMGENTITLYAPESTTYFYGVKSLEPEEFVKEGHLLVQIFNKILKTDNTSLIHGACIGMYNNGILICARGQRGKSTLTVLSLLRGFEYVSDDYLTLEKEGDNLYAYPIYSIITLSPVMYNRMYDCLVGTRFISNNARKDKYVLNIENFRSQFKTKYPIKICMSLEFTPDENPSIIECSQQEKGKAITQMVHSTTLQMHDMQDAKSIKKMIDMVNNFKFYKINLCSDIYKNVECLKVFIKEYDYAKLQVK